MKRIIRHPIQGLRWRLEMRKYPRTPVYVFHHIPKCGGISLHGILNQWFIARGEYRASWDGTNYPPPVKLNRLRSCHCLCGHYEMEGNHLDQRYPEVFTSERYRVFTFVREPLALLVSLYNFERMHEHLAVPDFEQHMLLRGNYIARQLGATAENYREVVDRYWFVGVLERGQESVDALASLMSKPRVQLPWVNRSERAANIDQLSARQLESIKQANSLDIAIYDYCNKKMDHRMRVSTM